MNQSKRNSVLAKEWPKSVFFEPQHNYLWHYGDVCLTRQ